jgi:acyl-CoA synthetase (NDP forming)
MWSKRCKEDYNRFRRISRIADEFGIRFIGPNCLGFYNNWIYPEDDTVALNTSIWEKLRRGKFSIASQSGTLSSHIWFDPENIDLGLSRSLSIGNEANIDIVDCLEYFRNDDKTEIIGLYIEEIKRGKEFLEIAKEITPHKPIIAIHLGDTKVAERAVKSHTGSIAGNSKIYNAVFKEAGIIKTELVEEFLDIAMVLSKGIYPKGRRVGIITNSGGPGAMIANHAEKLGLIIPEFSELLQEKLNSMTSHTSSVRNPLDTTFDMNLINYYINLPKAVMKSGEVDLIFMYGVFGFHDVLGKYLNNERIAKNIDMGEEFKNIKGNLEDMLVKPTVKLSKRLSIPIIYVNPENYSSPWSKRIRESGGILFQFWDRPVRALAKICDYVEFRKKFVE